MAEFDKTEQIPIAVISEVNSSSCPLPKKPESTLQPPPIEPHLLLKWGLALLGKEKANEYHAMHGSNHVSGSGLAQLQRELSKGAHEIGALDYWLI